jgi:hypothetical protein
MELFRFERHDPLIWMTNKFAHAPLDHSQPSIRLLRILPELSPNGLIQCHVWHATTDALYMCLSYRWGDPDPTHAVEINGRIARVRQNLYDFLTVARKDSSPGPYWIDALSIDQGSLLERNHQVAQMGSIFSKATCVHIWLGHASPRFGEVMQALRKEQTAITTRDWSVIFSNKNAIAKHIFRNEYFDRAWITQELLLACNAIVRLGADSLGLQEIIVGFENYALNVANTSLSDSPVFPFTNYMLEKLANESLVLLLARFREKKCENPYDRIYSLLSLCSGEGRNLTVDYGVSGVELAANVIHACKSSLCLCSAVLVLQTLGASRVDWIERASNFEDKPLIEFSVQAVYQHPNPTRWVLSGYANANQSARDPRSMQGAFLSFRDTCSSATFRGLRIEWDNNEGSPNRQVSWTRARTHRRSTYGSGFEFKRDGSGKGIHTVRIALWFLADIMAAELVLSKVDLCVRARQMSPQRRDVRIAPPRILRASDNE